jgi:hypothetical protein
MLAVTGYDGFRRATEHERRHGLAGGVDLLGHHGLRLGETFAAASSEANQPHLDDPLSLDREHHRREKRIVHGRLRAAANATQLEHAPRRNDPSSKRMADLLTQLGLNRSWSICHYQSMSMPKRLRQAVTARFGPLSKSLEQQFKTRENMMGELERRGYEARGKTDEQIVQMVRNGVRDSG